MTSHTSIKLQQGARDNYGDVFNVVVNVEDAAPSALHPLDYVVYATNETGQWQLGYFKPRGPGNNMVYIPAIRDQIAVGINANWPEMIKEAQDVVTGLMAQ